MDRRLKLEHKLSADPRLLNGALLDYAQDPCAFIGDCVFLAEPRHANTGEPTMLPCVLFPRQREFIEWLHERFTTKTSAPVEKSRDSGATWMSCAFAVWVWLFHPGSTVGFGSRKEILVDRAGDLQSIFEKIRSIVRNLPHYLKPRGFKEHTHSNYMRLLNPANDATIIGEAGDNIGRGGRTSMFFVDEAAYLERPALIEAALTATTDVRIDISTPCNGSLFNEWASKSSATKFVFDIFDVPLAHGGVGQGQARGARGQGAQACLRARVPARRRPPASRASSSRVNGSKLPSVLAASSASGRPARKWPRSTWPTAARTAAR